jgi:predicted phage terminase large subunit-like protein
VTWFGEGGVVGKAMEPILNRMMLERKTYCRTERLSPIADKASRARAFQGRAHAGRVVFPRRLWAERVINQCVAFPGGTHDDAFDVMAWMGLAIDQAHPALAPRDRQKKPRDIWSAQPRAKGWKVS